MAYRYTTFEPGIRSHRSRPYKVLRIFRCEIFGLTSHRDYRKEFPNVRRPAHGAVAGVAVDVFYSNYQNSSGILYPSNIRKSLNGTPWATITIQSIAFNTGLTDSDFPVQ